MTHITHTIAVVTEVPNPRERGVGAGNLAAPILFAKEGGDTPLAVSAMLNTGSEVFTKGEILILGPGGREVAGQGRKPSKWDITTEEFNDLEKAIARAEEVSS